MGTRRTVFASCVVAFLCANFSVEGRAEQAPVKRAPSGTTTSPPASTRPAAPAVVPGSRSPAPDVVPVTPVQPGKTYLPKPDYAISVDKQQEMPDGGMTFRFRVDNLGKVPGGKAKVDIHVGLPCPGGENWVPVYKLPGENYSIPALDPGKSTTFLSGLGTGGYFTTPHQYTGKGCRFRVEVHGGGVGFATDANPSNNRMHVFTKKLSLPDLVVNAAFGAGGPKMAWVKNVGDAPADPSVALFKCKALTEHTTCGYADEKRKAMLEMEVKVPALAPGQSHKIHSVMPDTEGSVQADKNNDVVERDETNNLHKWNK
jgi:hypothetical protein